MCVKITGLFQFMLCRDYLPFHSRGLPLDFYPGRCMQVLRVLSYTWLPEVRQQATYHRWKRKETGPAGWKVVNNCHFIWNGLIWTCRFASFLLRQVMSPSFTQLLTGLLHFKPEACKIGRTLEVSLVLFMFFPAVCFRWRISSVFERTFSSIFQPLGGPLGATWGQPRQFSRCFCWEMVEVQWLRCADEFLSCCGGQSSCSVWVFSLDWQGSADFRHAYWASACMRPNLGWDRHFFLSTLLRSKSKYLTRFASLGQLCLLLEVAENNTCFT